MNHVQDRDDAWVMRETMLHGAPCGEFVRGDTVILYIRLDEWTRYFTRQAAALWLNRPAFLRLLVQGVCSKPAERRERELSGEPWVDTRITGIYSRIMSAAEAEERERLGGLLDNHLSPVEPPRW